MKRIFENSNLEIGKYEEMKDTLENVNIIQVESNGELVIVEWCKYEDYLDMIPFLISKPQDMARNAPKGDINKVNEYREVELLKDPFMRYSGYTLGEIFDNKDIKWINKCLQDMKNEYIKDRVAYLVEYYKSRGEQWIN